MIRVSGQRFVTPSHTARIQKTAGDPVEYGEDFYLDASYEDRFAEPFIGQPYEDFCEDEE